MMEDWTKTLGAILQEEHPERRLDSIEVISVRAFLAGRGLEFPDDRVMPTTIEEWAQWAAHCSADS